MNDAGIETKRETGQTGPLRAGLGEYAGVVNAALAEAGQANVIERIWSKDAALDEMPAIRARRQAPVCRLTRSITCSGITLPV